MAEMSTQDINDLPDSAFAYVEAGGTKDKQGRTVPRSKRHFPIHDEAHVRNALTRAPQSPYGDTAMPKIKAAAKKFGIGEYAERVGPKGYTHGWKRAGGSGASDERGSAPKTNDPLGTGGAVGSEANKLTASPNPKAAVKEMDDQQLRDLDAEYQRRASALGKKGQVSKAHKAVLDEIKNREGQMNRSEPVYARSWALDDIHILRAADGGGDGRTVEAYAAVFDVPAEIRDQHGHYMEVIDRTAFNRTLAHGIDRVGVFYNHAMTMHGTPAEGVGSVPIGSPVDIRADARGLRTVTRYNKSELADHVLEAIRNGDLKGYSFRGKIFRSNPSRPPRAKGGSLATIVRTELGLTEYGPTPSPAYQDAGILAVRSSLERGLEAVDALLNRTTTPSTPDEDPDDNPATPDPGPGAEDPRKAHSGRQRELIRLRARLRDRGLS